MIALSARHLGIFLLGSAALLGASAPASAAALLLTTQTDDAAYEGAGGWLQTTYNLPLQGNTVLPQLERAVGQAKTGANIRRGLYIPTLASGIPAPVGTGVTTALTNFSPLAGGSDANFTNGAPIAFQISRLGTTISYTLGNTSWSDTKSFYADINAFQLRTRTNVGTAGTPTNSLLTSGLVFSDAVTNSQVLADNYAENGGVLINLYRGVTGDFTLSGNYTFAWTGAQPTGARLASQVKLLALPAIPEPATWAMLITGFGFVGSAMRRRHIVAA